MGLRLVYSICGLSKSKHCGQRSNKFCLGAVKALQAALLSFSRSISLSLSLSPFASCVAIVVVVAIAAVRILIKSEAKVK